MRAWVPLVDQLTAPTTDGGGNEDGGAQCVAAALASALVGVTGLTYEPDELKDAVYGESYTGATDPARYVAYLARQGVRMWAESRDTGDALVAVVKAHLAQGHRVYAAIPSRWGSVTAAEVNADPARYGTHAVMFCDADEGFAHLTAMNPWPVDGRSAFYQTMPSAWWASRIVYGHVFPVEAEMGIPYGWAEDKDASGKPVLRAPGSAYPVGTGFKDYIEGGAWPSVLVPVTAEYDVAEGWGTEQLFGDGRGLSVALRWRRADGAVWRAPGAAVVGELRGYVMPKLYAEIAALKAAVGGGDGGAAERLAALEGAIRTALVAAGA